MTDEEYERLCGYLRTQWPKQRCINCGELPESFRVLREELSEGFVRMGMIACPLCQHVRLILLDAGDGAGDPK